MRGRNTLIALLLGVSTALLSAKVTKDFPAHWGKPPEVRTPDYVELPDGFGYGSSTLKHWIAANLEKDKAAAGSAKPLSLYENNFEKAEAGKLPDELMVLEGDFVVKADGTNKFLELPGSPLDSYGVQFGPGEKENVAVSTRIFGTAKGRRTPTFGVGLGGVSGFKLQVSPGKKALEILKDQEVVASVVFDWKPGEWTCLHLQIRKVRDGEWKVEGKAWAQGTTEPMEWMISFDEKEQPVAGRASVLGSPLSGTPIWFDDLVVERIAGK